MATVSHARRRPSVRAKLQMRRRNKKPKSARRLESENVFIQSFFGLASASAHLRKGDEQAKHLGNPLAVSSLQIRLSPAQAHRLLQLRRWQHRLWSLLLALTIVLFFILSIIELDEGITHLLPAPAESMREFLFWADLAAISVFVIEFGAQYRQYKNKMLFFKHNWLGLVSIVPMGFLFRAARVVEGVEAVRTLQMAGKMNELGVVLPDIRLAGDARVALPRINLADAMLHVQGGLAHFNVVTDFIDLVTETLARLLRF